jgi:hypothetical protein
LLQYEKAKSSIAWREVPDSKRTHSRQLHPAKQDSPKVATEGGMEIERREEQSEKAPDAIRRSREPGSNVISTREATAEKQFGQMSSTLSGMQTDFRQRHFVKSMDSSLTIRDGD